MKSNLKYILTGVIVFIAVGVVFIKYKTMLTNPWTRDGQVQANVIEIAARVSGPIVALPIRDNQFVNAGELLYAIDPRTYQANLDQALAMVEQTRGNVDMQGEQIEGARAGVEAARASIDQARSGIAQVEAMLAKGKAELERQQDLLPKKATSKKALERAQASYDVTLEKKKVAQAALHQAESNLLKAQAALAQAVAQLGASGESNPQLRQALATLRQAELNVEFTQVRAPVDGYVTNLRLRLGSQVNANQSSLALVDTASYWVDGYFKENLINDIESGDSAFVTLMTYPDQPIESVVDSIGLGIFQQDGSPGGNLLPRVSATFEWIRLAQRVPVRIHLGELPEGIILRVGTTCSVLVRKGTAHGQAN